MERMHRRHRLGVTRRARSARQVRPQRPCRERVSAFLGCWEVVGEAESPPSDPLQGDLRVQEELPPSTGPLAEESHRKGLAYGEIATFVQVKRLLQYLQ